MKLFKKIISLFLIWLYWYTQSVFSHLLIIDQHHEIKSISQDHIHESWETHEHIYKAIESCKDSECETTCNNIEIAKLTSHQPIKLFWEIEEQYWEIELPVDSIRYINSPSKEFLYYLIPTWPPIPIEELMSRVWPVVRVI